MAEQAQFDGSEATYTPPFEYNQKERAEISFGGVRVENGQIKLPPEAMNLLQSSRNEIHVHRHIQEIKTADPETYAHTWRTALNTMALVWINRDVDNISETDAKRIAKAVLLHDGGKLDLKDVPQVYKEEDPEIEPESGKPIYAATGEVVKLHQVNRNFTAEERKDAAKHPLLSVARLQNKYHIDDPLILGMIVLHHQTQENPTMTQEDARGVLEDLKLSDADKSKVLKYAQFIETADKYDAATSNRPDKPASTPQEARDYLYAQFDNKSLDRTYPYQLTSLYLSGT